MKFLIALSVLASSTVFAQSNPHHRAVKCYDTAQGNDMEVVYKFKKWDDKIKLVFPHSLEQEMRVKHDCLVSDYQYPEAEAADLVGNKIKFCPTEGQRVNGLVPVDVSFGHDEQQEETVYCEKGLVKWIRWSDGMGF